MKVPVPRMTLAIKCTQTATSDLELPSKPHKPSQGCRFACSKQCQRWHQAANLTKGTAATKQSLQGLLSSYTVTVSQSIQRLIARHICEDGLLVRQPRAPTTLHPGVQALHLPARMTVTAYMLCSARLSAWSRFSSAFFCCSCRSGSSWWSGEVRGQRRPPSS